MKQHYAVVIVGGGQSGLVSGYQLKRAGITDFVILDANAEIGGSWQQYYDSLRLFSPARYGQLPGLRFPGDPNRYPTKSEVIAYLREYARVHELPVKSGTRVSKISQTQEGLFCLDTSAGILTAQSVISASGSFNTPYTPTIEGAETFTGKTLHAYDYRNPQPFSGQHVIVVGARDSAMQIAYDLMPHARVTMALRHPLKFMPKYVLGKSIFWWLHDTGYDQLPLGLFTHLKGSESIVGKQPYQDALKAGKIATKPMFTRITASGVVWQDGSEEPADTLLYATGYKPGLTYLASLLGALDAEGHACQHDGVSTTIKGLYYVGLFGQRSHASATLRGVGKDAERVTQRIAHYLAASAPQLPQVAQQITN